MFCIPTISICFLYHYADFMALISLLKSVYIIELLLNESVEKYLTAARPKYD